MSKNFSFFLPEIFPVNSSIAPRGHRLKHQNLYIKIPTNKIKTVNKKPKKKYLLNPNLIETKNLFKITRGSKLFPNEEQ